MEQQHLMQNFVQIELTAQKERLGRLNANILKGEDYSKLKQIVKENVKAVICDNKKLISVSFPALIQTLRTDPQIANLIYSIYLLMRTMANNIKIITLPNTLKSISIPY